MTTSGRRIVLACIAFALLPWAASAQDNPGNQDNQQQNAGQPQARRQQQQRRMAALWQRLNITPDQKRQWLEIQRETTRQVRAARRNDLLTEPQMQARLKQIHKEQKERVMALLTPDQQNQIKAFWEEQKQRQQQSKAANAENGGSASANESGDGKEDDDDLFAGMVSDDPDPAPPAQGKPTGHK